MKDAFARFGTAGLLFIAAMVKMFYLFAVPVQARINGSTWLEAGLIEYEVLLAVWLLSGIGLQWARRIALGTFGGFGFYALFLGIKGHGSCGCFGGLHVNPWWTFAVDMTIVLSLLIWTPRCIWGGLDGGLLATHFLPRMLLVNAATFAIVFPTLVTTAKPSFPEASIEGSLANGQFVLLDAENWIGQPFPLTDFIAIAEPKRLLQGSWIVVLYRNDCPKCQQAIDKYVRLSEQFVTTNDDTQILLVEIPPYRPVALIAASQRCHLGRLKDGREWVTKTPVEVRIANGRVIAVDSEVVHEMY